MELVHLEAPATVAAATSAPATTDKAQLELALGEPDFFSGLTGNYDFCDFEAFENSLVTPEACAKLPALELDYATEPETIGQPLSPVLVLASPLQEPAPTSPPACLQVQDPRPSPEHRTPENTRKAQEELPRQTKKPKALPRTREEQHLQ
eukprot:SAG11_NODE_159_length_14027_cov_6.893667_4_plen_150_part_00